jgi:hypothetical protein
MPVTIYGIISCPLYAQLYILFSVTDALQKFYHSDLPFDPKIYS